MAFDLQLLQACHCMHLSYLDAKLSSASATSAPLQPCLLATQLEETPTKPWAEGIGKAHPSLSILLKTACSVAPFHVIRSHLISTAFGLLLSLSTSSAETPAAPATKGRHHVRRHTCAVMTQVEHQCKP